MLTKPKTFPGFGPGRLFSLNVGSFGQDSNPKKEFNDHVIRASVLNRDFHWHSHEDSDETFLVLEGTLELDHEGGTETLTAGELFTVPRGVKHRTRAQGRVLNLTFEQKETDVTGGKEA